MVAVRRSGPEQRAGYQGRGSERESLGTTDTTDTTAGLAVSARRQAVQAQIVSVVDMRKEPMSRERAMRYGHLMVGLAAGVMRAGGIVMVSAPRSRMPWLMSWPQKPPGPKAVIITGNDPGPSQGPKVVVVTGAIPEIPTARRPSSSVTPAVTVPAHGRRHPRQ